MNLKHRCLALAGLLFIATSLQASDKDQKRKLPPPDPTEDPVMMSAGFLDWHPDIAYRIRGVSAMHREEYEDAMRFFRRAAFFADKPSQAMMAEMLWKGQGVPANRPAGYAWMDLAAERGYRMFIAHREQYWAQMSEAERAQAIEEGEAVYAVFGDAAARPRIDTKLRRGRARVTGSRTGFVGNLTIEIPGPDGSSVTMDGSKFFDDRYWDPKQYQAWHDEVWSKPMIPRVRVGDVEKADQAGAEVKSRVPETRPDHAAPEPEVPQEKGEP